MNFFEVKQEQMMQVLTYSTVIEKSKLEFILNETKNIKHQPLVFFSLKLVIAGFKDSDKIYYTGFKAQANKTTADGNTESDERFYTFYNKSRKINNIKIISARRTKLN
jgi:hypothetical protein